MMGKPLQAAVTAGAQALGQKRVPSRPLWREDECRVGAVGNKQGSLVGVAGSPGLHSRRRGVPQRLEEGAAVPGCTAGPLLAAAWYLCL